MHIAYTRPKKNTKVLATAIAWFTREKHQKLSDVPSHMILIFFNKLVLEAKAGGVRLTYLPNFLKHNVIIKSFVRSDLTYMKDAYLPKALDKFYGKPYDYIALFWYAIFLIRKKLFKMDLPNMKQFQRSHRSYCSELLKITGDIQYTHMSPNQQMIALEKDVNYTRLL